MSTVGTPAPAPAPAAAQDAGRRCPNCASPLSPEQEWCLACGAATTTRVAAPRGWRVPLLAAGAIVALLLAAALLALVALARGPETVAPAATPAPSASAAAPAPTPAPTVAATPTPAPTAGSTSSGGAGLARWPAGRTAWTVVLESARSRAKAARVARSLQTQGATVGLLDSDAHPSLRPGYWVVFSGTYASRAAAEAALESAGTTRPGAYVRRVTS
jgi:septal ring-binding cell division protein DamX